MYETRTHFDNVKTALKSIEASGDSLHIDQAAFVLGMFGPNTYWVANVVQDCPRIAALLPEMKECPSPPRRMLQIGQWMDRDDDVGYLADQLRKWNP